MTATDFQVISPVLPQYLNACFRCRASVDFLEARFCDCVTRERTLICPQCGGCACEAAVSARNEFWVAGPKALWERKRVEEGSGAESLESLDPNSIPRPLALIADDDPIVLSVASRALRAMGFTTLMTSNAVDALTIASQMLPDLVLTDALMPRMDGRQLSLALKSNARTRHIKVIVMSALYRGTVQRNEAFRHFRVDEFLSKPIKPGILRDAVQRLMPKLVLLRSDAAWMAS